MNWLQCMIYGLISGLSEFLPVSVSAHNQILRQLFGIRRSDPVADLIVHICALGALYIAWRAPIDVIRRETRMAARGTRVYNRIYRGNLDARFIKSAATIGLISMALLRYLNWNVASLPIMALVLIINGVVLYLPSRLMQGNKDARLMSTFDAMLVGIGSALSVIPGISRIGLSVSVSVMRGADQKHALNWAYLLSIPVLILLIGMDFLSIIFSSGGLSLSAGFWGYLLIGISAFIGAYIAITAMKFLAANRNTTVFAYCSWGVALLALILYLI